MCAKVGLKRAVLVFYHDPGFARIRRQPVNAQFSQGHFSHRNQHQRFCVVNPSAVDAAVTFTLYRADGTVKNATERGRSRRAAGWRSLEATCFQTRRIPGGLRLPVRRWDWQGFWMAGDWTTFMDGADARRFLARSGRTDCHSAV